MDKCFQLEKVLKDRDITPTVRDAKVINVQAKLSATESKALVGLDTCAGVHILNNDSHALEIVQGESVIIRGFDGNIKTSNDYGQWGILGETIILPEADISLLSYSKLARDGFDITYDKQHHLFNLHKGDHFIGSFHLTSSGIYVSDIYKIDAYPKGYFYTCAIDIESMSKTDKSRIERVHHLHNCLAHPRDELLKIMLDNNLIINCDLTSHDVDNWKAVHGKCIGCLRGKTTHTPASKSMSKTYVVDELVHMDLMQLAGQTYLIAVDDYCGHISSITLSDKRTRPDILKEISFLSTKSSKPTVEDEEQLDKVLRYINETKDFDLIFNVFDLTVHAYIDASFAVNTDAKSHTGAIISLGPNGGTLYAKSSKQKLVTWSSTEAELVAVHDAMAHSLNVQNIVKELTGVYKPIQLHQDNLSTIHLINSQEAVGQRSRHINIRYFSILLSHSIQSCCSELKEL